jgi:hypothetical protein
MIDSNCYRSVSHCQKPEASTMRVLARWEEPFHRSNNKFKKLTYDLRSLEADAVSFPAGRTEGSYSVREGVPLYVLPDYPKAASPVCTSKTEKLVKKSESALRRIPISISVRVWKDEETEETRTRDFMISVAVPPDDETGPPKGETATPNDWSVSRSDQPGVPGPVEVFISYAREDANIKEEIVKLLIPLQDEGLIAFWHDREIVAGQDWAHDIHTKLTNAKVVLLLVSRDMIASRYINGVELNIALKRHEAGQARLIPVIIRTSDWSRAKFSKLQALPSSALPISNYEDRDEWFTEVTKGLRRVIEELVNKPGPHS